MDSIFSGVFFITALIFLASSFPAVSPKVFNSFIASSFVNSLSVITLKN